MNHSHRIFGTVIAVLLAANVAGGVWSRVSDDGAPGGNVIAVLGVAVLLVAILFGIAMLVRRKPWIGWLALRVILIAVFVSILLAYPLWFIAGYEDSEIRIRQALIAATIVAAGWLVTFLVQEYRRESDREERRDDVRRAIRTEIELHYIDVHDTDWNALRDRMSNEFYKDSRFVPFAPRRNRDRFLSVAIARVELLSESQIVEVMRYYELAERLELMNEDMRSEKFAEMNAARRESMALRFLSLEETCMKYALEAIKSLSPPGYFEQMTDKYPPAVPSKTGQAPSCPEGEA